jgi:hypothetical protein
MHVVLTICIRIKRGVHGMFSRGKCEHFRLQKVRISHQLSRFLNTYMEPVAHIWWEMNFQVGISS